MGLAGVPTDFNYEEMHAEFEGHSLEDVYYGSASRDKSVQEVALDFVKKLNPDQMAAFDEIAQALLGRGAQRLFMVKGDGGCGNLFYFIICIIFIGKSYLYNTLIRWVLAGKPDYRQIFEGSNNEQIDQAGAIEALYRARDNVSF